MAIVKPFAALRPKPELAARICELPYDVMSSDEARAMAAGNPLSFLHVSKPEIDLSLQIDPYAPEVYAKGKANFEWLQRQGALRCDASPRFYLYRQVMGAHSQVGLVAGASCDEYLMGVIKKHELTRPDKEDDRVRHIEALQSQTGPVFLVYRARAGMDGLASRKTAEPPETDFTAPDGVRHSVWVLDRAEEIAFIEAEFAQMASLYIADGHHRSAAAARVFQKRKDLAGETAAGSAKDGVGGSAGFLSVIFPHDQVQILPYNRVLKDLNGLNPEQLLARLRTVFHFGEAGLSVPGEKHELTMFLAGRWQQLRFRSELVAAEGPVGQLDVALLQRHVLDPIFGITDPRTSKRVNFVGGIRGVEELERLVGSGDYACAFAMVPTGIEDLLAIADAGGIMPPKSTWFEPKLRDALFCRSIA